MNQAKLTHLVSKLRIKLEPKPRLWSHPDRGIGRLRELRDTVTELVRYERIEHYYYRAEMSREYAERLLSEAIRYGDCHKPTMDLANFWLVDKTLVPKLFKVLAVRYRDWPIGLPYTRMLRAPKAIVPEFPDENKIGPEATPNSRDRAVLELRGNPYPPLPGPMKLANPGLIHNVLLEEARKDYFRSQSKLVQSVEGDLLDNQEILPSSNTLEENSSPSVEANENKISS